MNRFLLDTSIFTNPDVFRAFGSDAQEAIRCFAGLARATGAEFYMPGSVYEELSKIKDLSEVAADFESVVRIRSPRRHTLTNASALLYELIEEVRYWPIAWLRRASRIGSWTVVGPRPTAGAGTARASPWPAPRTGWRWPHWRGWFTCTGTRS